MVPAGSRKLDLPAGLVLTQQDGFTNVSDRPVSGRPLGQYSLTLPSGPRTLIRPDLHPQASHRGATPASRCCPQMAQLPAALAGRYSSDSAKEPTLVRPGLLHILLLWGVLQSTCGYSMAPCQLQQADPGVLRAFADIVSVCVGDAVHIDETVCWPSCTAWAVLCKDDSRVGLSDLATAEDRAPAGAAVPEQSLDVTVPQRGPMSGNPPA